MLLSLTESRRAALNFWGPAIAAGLVAWLLFLAAGHTALVRASGLGLVVVAVALMLRRWGALLAFLGALAFALGPAFWSQTGGSESLGAASVFVGVGVALAIWLLAARITRHPVLALVFGIAIFAVLFLVEIGGPRSLRLTTLLAAWALYLLVDGLLLTNPRPDEHDPAQLRLRHTLGLLVLLLVGVTNDPLFTLLIPAVLLGLFLSRARLPRWYWAGLFALLVVGFYGIARLYVDPVWWAYPASAASRLTYNIPYLIWGGWREPERWIDVFTLVVDQFTPFGLALGVVGLARLSRWYPPVGVTSMIAYATYFLFGLVYLGRDAAVLLLPLLMIQTFWITYAVYALGQWLQRSFASRHSVRWLAPAAFTLLPLFLLLKIAGVF